MALQEKIIVCGASLTALGMALRFVAGPAATAAGAVALGLRGDVLRLAIIQVTISRCHFLNVRLFTVFLLHMVINVSSTGRTSSIHHHVRVRQGVRPAR
jgi:hypothetical protein